MAKIESVEHDYDCLTYFIRVRLFITVILWFIPTRVVTSVCRLIYYRSFFYNLFILSIIMVSLIVAGGFCAVSYRCTSPSSFPASCLQGYIAHLLPGDNSAYVFVNKPAMDYRFHYAGYLYRRIAPLTLPNVLLLGEP